MKRHLQPLAQIRAAVVTGASSGLGEALALHLVRHGWSVLGLATNLKDEDRQGDGGALWRTRSVDLADFAAARRHVAEFAATCGRLDALVNNAAVQFLGTAEEISGDDWHKSLAVNLTAPLELTRESIPWMRKAGGGVVLNIASVHASATGPRRTAYAATKAGLVGLTRSIAIDYGPENIRAIALSPGPFATAKLTEGIANLYPDLSPADATARYAAQLPLRRVGDVAEFAEFAASLLGASARFISGTEIHLDGGLLARLAVGQ